MSNTVQKRIEELLSKAIEEKEIAGASVLFVQNGVETFCAKGFADVESKTPIKRDTIFRLYSMSKPITSAAAMRALELGLFDLADPVSKYIPGFKGQKVWQNGKLIEPQRETCLRDLMFMGSGLSYGGESDSGKDVSAVINEGVERMYTENAMTTSELANRFGKCGLEFQPGERYMYGVSADIIGAVIEAAAGCSFGEFLKRELLEPLEMHDTDFYVPEEKQSRLARTYYRETLEEYTGDNLIIQNRMKTKPAFESGGAGLASTIEDYSHFAAMLLNGGKWKGKQILSKAAVEYMTSPQLSEQQRLSLPWEALLGYSYGNFLRIMQQQGNGACFAVSGEYGWDGWLGPYFINIPGKNSTILMMMQRVDSGTWSLTRKIRNAILSAE